MNLTDRELLRLAAKAAGIEVRYQPVSHRFLIQAPLATMDGTYFTYWDPLTDDGDALRLAVKLGLDVCIDSQQENEPHTHAVGFRYDYSAETVDAIEDHGDPYAATRRAIVRAAAQIAHGIKENT